MKRNFFTDKTALSIPWVEGPFFKKLMEHHGSDYTDDEFYLLANFNEYGFVKIDLELSDADIDAIKNDVSKKIDKGEIVTQDKRYHYNNSPRVFEAWKDCQSVLDIARHPKIIKTLKLLYDKDPIPFQTINFVKGSNQPLHSDAVHFHTIPHKWMAGVWVALEDMDENNGTLCYVPKSHHWDVYEFPDLNLNVPEFGQQFEQYEAYESFLKFLCSANNAQSEALVCKKGTAFIWAANLLHGGIPVVDETRTRWSQAIHYYFEGCKYYFSPLFSDKHEGKWSLKNIGEKDILNHSINGD